jgi:hypothetical protein
VPRPLESQGVDLVTNRTRTRRHRVPHKGSFRDNAEPRAKHGYHIKPAAALLVAEITRGLGAALGAAYRGGRWFESTAAHTRFRFSMTRTDHRCTATVPDLDDEHQRARLLARPGGDEAPCRHHPTAGHNLCAQPVSEAIDVNLVCRRDTMLDEPRQDRSD